MNKPSQPKSHAVPMHSSSSPQLAGRHPMIFLTAILSYALR
jgi:hypothetical protein